MRSLSLSLPSFPLTQPTSPALAAGLLLMLHHPLTTRCSPQLVKDLQESRGKASPFERCCCCWLLTTADWKPNAWWEECVRVCWFVWELSSWSRACASCRWGMTLVHTHTQSCVNLFPGLFVLSVFYLTEGKYCSVCVSIYLFACVCVCVHMLWQSQCLVARKLSFK